MPIMNCPPAPVDVSPASAHRIVLERMWNTWQIVPLRLSEIRGTLRPPPVMAACVSPNRFDDHLGYRVPIGIGLGPDIDLLIHRVSTPFRSPCNTTSPTPGARHPRTGAKEPPSASCGRAIYQNGHFVIHIKDVGVEFMKQKRLIII